ncbi:MAG: hypothetical protein LBQ52_02290, partial [Helicobacteraceae bacterium]|nr:hypothetical protein [Helicobacteraceae bacterium]
RSFLASLVFRLVVGKFCLKAGLEGQFRRKTAYSLLLSLSLGGERFVYGLRYHRKLLLGLINLTFEPN